MIERKDAIAIVRSKKRLSIKKAKESLQEFLNSLEHTPKKEQQALKEQKDRSNR